LNLNFTPTGRSCCPVLQEIALMEADRRRSGIRRLKGMTMAQTIYQVRVSGTISAELMPELSDLTVTVEPPETVLLGSLPDQSALFRLISRIHSLGLHLIEVRRLPGDERPHEHR